MSKYGKHGVSENTLKNIPFGAGTIHKGLKYEEGEWNFEESIVGATSGGSKFSIVPEFTTLELDGVNVDFKGGDVKTGETATLEVNWAELSPDIIKTALVASEKDSTDTGYTLIESKPDIKTDDYWENIAFVGRTLSGSNIIVILDNAICTSGMELEGKKKEQGVLATTFKSTAELAEDSDLDTLPYHIYYPKQNN